MKRDKRAGAEAGVGPAGFPTGTLPAYSDGRSAPDNIRSATNRSRASRIHRTKNKYCTQSAYHYYRLNEVGSAFCKETAEKCIYDNE